MNPHPDNSLQKVRILVRVIGVGLVVALAGSAHAATLSPVARPAHGKDSHARVTHDRQRHSRDLVQEIRKLRQAIEVGSGGGGGDMGPLGTTCAEARERMRWSTMPCAPGMPLQ